MVIEATYKNGSKREITNYTLSNHQYLKTSQKAIKITYTECGITRSVEQEIVVTKKESVDVKLTEIKIVNPPNKTKYQEGEDFDKTGMVIMGYYSNGESKEITNYLISDGQDLENGQNKITITYTENSVVITRTQKITVVGIDENNRNEDEEENKDNNEGEDNNNQNEGNNDIVEDNNNENEDNNDVVEDKEENEEEVIEVKPELLLMSGNNYLRNLSVNAGGSGINFEREVRDYKIEVASTVEDVEVEAYKEDKNAKVEIIRNKKLTYGKNFISVVVEAQNGLKRTYTVEVVRQEKNIPEIDTTELENLVKQDSNSAIVKENEDNNIYSIIILITVIASVSSLLVVLIKKREK